MSPFLVPITFFAACAVVCVGLPIARAVARRMDREAAAPRLPGDVTARLERMEQSIDAIAVEIERISEGQRFTTKLLADRGAQAPADRPA